MGAFVGPLVDPLEVKFRRPRALCLSEIWGLYRGQIINANFFCTKFFGNPSGHGCPRQKSWTSAPKSAFSCGPGGMSAENPDQKFMFMLFFSSLTLAGLEIRVPQRCRFQRLKDVR